MKGNELLFKYKVRARHRLGWKEFVFYATTDIEEFLNRNSIEYVRDMIHPFMRLYFEDLKEKENEKII